MSNNRRDFLKKALKVGVATGIGAIASENLLANSDKNTNGVLDGYYSKKKKEVLYHESDVWKKYYKIAY